MKGNSIPLLDSLGLCLTRRCDLQCEHCYLAAGPHRMEEMAEAHLKHILEESAPSVRNLWFSGGEPTLNLNLLRSALEYAAERRRTVGLPAEIIVQTNAAWATDSASAMKMLSDLRRWGATGINIASNDIYHWKQIGRQPPLLAYRTARAMGCFSIVEMLQTVTRSGPRRLGRARKLDESETAQVEYCKMLLAGYHYAVDTDGSLYPCCYLIAARAGLGNLRHRSLKYLIDCENKLVWPALLRKGGPELVRKELVARTGSGLEREPDETLCELCGRITRLWGSTVGRRRRQRRAGESI